MLAAQQSHYGEAVFRAREAMRHGGGPDLNAAMLLASAIANDKVAASGARSRKWEEPVRELLIACTDAAPRDSGATRAGTSRPC